MKFVGLAVFFLTISITAQVEHAPTVAQCQADQRLWLAALEEESKGGNGLPTYDALEAWNHEMVQCEDVDPDNRHRYYNVVGEVTADELLRLEHFVSRHNMLVEFRKEDAAGKR